MRHPEHALNALLDEFGCIGAIGAPGVSKTRISRCAVDHAASEAVHDFRILLQEVLSRRVRQRPIINNWRALLDHLHADMAHASVERFRVLHLDTRNALIRDEIMSEGTIDHTAVHVRKVVTRALELGSASLILVHNHPSGTTSPSRADVAITRRLVQACQAVELVVHDHLIIGAEGHTSMRAEGLM